MTTCVVITSLIDTGIGTFEQYGVKVKRSGYTPSERLIQLLETIASVKKMMPSVNIAIIECNEKLVEADLCLHGPVQLINLWTNTYVRSLVSTHPNKGFCECLMLREGLREVDYFDNYFKLTGRYLLLDNCPSTALLNTRKYLCTNQMFCFGLNGMNTFFYKVLDKDKWCDALDKAKQECLSKNAILERVLRKYLPFEIWPHKLGVMQRLGQTSGHKAYF